MHNNADFERLMDSDRVKAFERMTKRNSRFDTLAMGGAGIGFVIAMVGWYLLLTGRHA